MINMLTNKSNKTRIRIQMVIIVILFTLIFTGHSGVGFLKMGINYVGGWISGEVSQVIDNHEYAELPFDILMTDTDKDKLNEPDIQSPAEVDLFTEGLQVFVTDIQQTLSDVGEKFSVGANYEESVNNPSALDSIQESFKNSEVVAFFKGIAGDMLNFDYTYPSSIDVTAIGQLRVGESNHWVVQGEWKALQDSTDFLVYPFEMTLDENLAFVDATAHEKYESAVYTRPLVNDAVIGDVPHQSFLELWDEFKVIFKHKEGTPLSDNEHLVSLVDEEISVETLEKMYEDSRGDLNNAGITSYMMNDHNADAQTIYTLSIPTDNKGTMTTVEIVYSRPYNEILKIDIIR